MIGRAQGSQDLNPPPCLFTCPSDSVIPVFWIVLQKYWYTLEKDWQANRLKQINKYSPQWTTIPHPPHKTQQRRPSHRHHRKNDGSGTVASSPAAVRKQDHEPNEPLNLLQHYNPTSPQKHNSMQTKANPHRCGSRRRSTIKSMTPGVESDWPSACTTCKS